MNRIESVQKRVLHLLYNDFENSYSKLSDKAKKSPMTIVRLRCLCLEICKTINRLQPVFMTNIFKLSDSIKPAQKQRFSKKFRDLGPKIWNNLPAHIKSAPNHLSV